MMQKKGVAWQYIFEFTLGAIILGLIIYIFFPNLIPYPSKIWNETRSAFDKHEGEFKPYEDQLTAEEKTMDDSMKALVCALRSTAEGKLDGIDCPGGKAPEKKVETIGSATTEKVECNGLLFGTKCVECDRQYKFGSEENKLDLNDLSKVAIECADTFKKTYTYTFCGLIPKNSVGGSITQDDLRKQLKENEGDEVAKLFKRDNIYVYPSPFDASKTYYIMATTWGNSIIFLSGDILLNPRSVPLLPLYVIQNMHNTYFSWVDEHNGQTALNKFSCNVRGFELPQEIGTASAKDYIKGLGDPKHLVYYEKFPDGEEKAWQFEAKTMVLIGLGVRTALVFVPYAGKLFKLPGLGGLIQGSRLRKLQRLTIGLDKLDDAAKAKRLAKIGKVLDKLSKNEKYLTEGLEVLAKAGQKEYKAYALLSDDVADNIAWEVLGKIQEAKKEAQLARNVKLEEAQHSIIRNEIKTLYEQNNAGKLLPYEYKDLYTQAWEGKLDNFNSVKSWLKSRGNLEQVGIEGIKNLHPSTLTEVGKRMTFKRMLPALMVDSETGRLTSNGLAKAMEKSVKGLKALKNTKPQLYDDALTEAEKLAKGFIDKEGNIDFGRLLGEAPDDALTTLFKTIDEGQKYGVEVTSIKQLLSGRTIGEGVWKGTIQGTVGPLPSGTTWGKIEDMLKNTLKVGGCVPVAGSKTMCLDFVRDHFLPIMIGLGYFAQLQDKEMRKFVPVGKNKLGLLYGENVIIEEKKLYDLPQANQYYITMVKEDDSKNRFFAASPCKTDYKIKKDYCICEMRYGDYVYATEEGKLQTVEPPPITDKSQIETVYMWDKLSEEDRAKFLLNHNFFGEQSPYIPEESQAIREQEIHNGFAHIRWTFEDTPEILEEYHKVMFKEPDEFLVTLSLMYSYNGEVQAMKRDFKYPTQENVERTLGPFKDLIKIRTFSDEEFRKFQIALIEFYDETETQRCSLGSYKYCYDQFTYEYEKNGKNEKIEIPKIWDVLDPSKGFVLFPVGRVRYYASDRDELLITLGSLETMNYQINPGFFWYKKNGQIMMQEEIKQKEEEYNNLWFNPRVDWQDRRINYQKLFSDIKVSYSSFPKMMAYRFYHSTLFDESARKASYQYHIYKGPTENVVKNCREIEVNEGPPTLKDIDTKYSKKTVVPCLTVVPDGITSKYKDYNGGLNYCYSAKNWQLEFAEDMLTAASCIGGLLVMGLTGDPMSGVSIAVVAAELGSIATTFIIEKCGEWPKHSAGLYGCF